MGLRSWRIPSRSSPNISEAVNKESYPPFQRTALTPWRVLRSRREDRDSEQWKQTSPSRSSLTCLDEPQKIQAALSCAGPCLSRTLSVPETCSTSLSSGFSSISITARRVSLSGDLSSRESNQEMSPMIRPEQHHSSSASIVSVRYDIAAKGNIPSTNPSVSFRRKATMVKGTEDGERYDTGEGLSASLAPPEHRHSYADSGTASHALARSRREANEASLSPLVSKRLIYRSCAHLELLPCQSTSSIVFLDKSFSISLGCPREDRQAMHTSTLSLYLGGVPLSSHPGKLQGTGVPFRSSSEWNLVDFTRNGTGEQFSCLEDMTTVNSRPTSSDSTAARASLAPWPFRARCHSSSAVVRLNGKANDVSGPLQSSRERGVDGSGISGGSRVPCGQAETVLKVQKCPPVSPHMLNCTCGCDSNNQSHILSLKEALEIFRPDFISRSQRRVRRLEQRARERRSLQTTDLTIGMESTIRRQNCTKTHPLSDNLFKPKDRVISGKEMQLRSRRIYNKLPEVTKKKEEEKRRLVLQTNRLRADVFKKKLLDQILQRHSD